MLADQFSDRAIALIRASLELVGDPGQRCASGARSAPIVARSAERLGRVRAVRDRFWRPQALNHRGRPSHRLDYTVMIDGVPVDAPLAAMMPAKAVTCTTPLYAFSVIVAVCVLST